MVSVAQRVLIVALVLTLTLALATNTNSHTKHGSRQSQIGVTSGDQQVAIGMASRQVDQLSQGVYLGDSKPMSQQSDVARPLTIEATPLDEDEGSSSSDSSTDSEDDEGEQSASSSGSSSRATPLRSLSSSLGCGCPPEKPKRRCPTGIPPGPCGGGGKQVLAKIVDKLGGGGKKFHDGPSAKAIWTFTDTSGIDPAANEAQITEMAKKDVVLKQLTLKLEHMQDQMENEKMWVEDVQQMVNHYKTKAASVAGALKNQATEVKALKAAIIARQKLAARKVLEQKLLKVNAQLQALQATTSSVSGEAKSLGAVQQALHKSIQGIQSEIERLRASK